MARWLYCARGQISVAMKAGAFNYPLHGHDLTVEACICSDRKEDIDLLVLHEKLDRILKPLDYRELERSGLSTLEDIALKVAGELGACIVRVYTPRGMMVEYRSIEDASTG